MTRRRVVLIMGAVLGTAIWALGNGGPFVVKYPNGDPAAKGVLARLDRDLKPGREERLRVVKEDLKIAFLRDPLRGPPPAAATAGAEQPFSRSPLAMVTAAYTIENPTDGEITVDFGFPILRGIYMHPWSMMPRPDAQVRLDDKEVQVNIVSNSMIYGIIRQRCQEAIDKALAGDPELARLVAKVRAGTYMRQRAREAVTQAIAGNAAAADAARSDAVLSSLVAVESDAKEPQREANRQALMDHLTGPKKWSREAATLLVEYASTDLGVPTATPPDRSHYWGMAGPSELNQLTGANLGRLSAIGEQKATQLFAELASRFDPNVKTAYEAIFSAWGGDVRERCVDLASGEVRPRELAIDPKLPEDKLREIGYVDPTVYARVDYLAPHANLTETEQASLRAILKNLPVVFTFAPMNLLHYQVKFPARSTHVLAVSYKQYAYLDTRGSSSYQLAYVLHPASMWKEFGPIELEVAVPEGVSMRASVECQPAGVETRELPKDLRFPAADKEKGVKMAVHRATVHEKNGELFVAVEGESWRKATSGDTQTAEGDPRSGRVTPQSPPGRQLANRSASTAKEGR